MTGAGLESVFLPLNFSQTFLPERRLLGQLLPFAAAEGSGNKEEIGAKTGIPTGKSTGKVEPMIRYAQAMGLVRTGKDAGIWRLALTPLGRVVLQDDAFLSEPLTQWMMHLMLCRRRGLGMPPSGVADAWFLLFAEGGFRLGKRFTQDAYLAFLRDRHGELGYLKSLSGLVLRSYLQESCLAATTVLRKETDEVYVRQQAPVETDFYPAYAAYLYLVWDDLYPTETQLALDEFAAQSRFLAVLGWEQEQTATWLDWMVDKGLVQLDRHTGGALLLRLQGTEGVVTEIYSELI